MTTGRAAGLCTRTRCMTPPSFSPITPAAPSPSSLWQARCCPTAIPDSSVSVCLPASLIGFQLLVGIWRYKDLWSALFWTNSIAAACQAWSAPLTWRGRVVLLWWLPYVSLCTLLSRPAVMQDATDEFNAIHSAKAKAMLKEYLIGRVGEAKAVQAKLPGIKEDEVSAVLVTLLPFIVTSAAMPQLWCLWPFSRATAEAEY